MAGQQSVHSNKVRVAVICGGSSLERGISLNSARSILDHLQSADVSIDAYYFDVALNAYQIPVTQMYSNTPSDFDFKLKSVARSFSSISEFLNHVKTTSDIAFPALHGKFGEDGQIQALLEGAGIPFVGTDSVSAARAFDKYTAASTLSELGFATIPSFLFLGLEDNGRLLQWFETVEIDPSVGRVVVKPARAGSSFGVSVALGFEEASRKALDLIAEEVDERVVIEKFAEGGREFTAIVLDGVEGSDPVTLLPTEVELQGLEESEDGDRAVFNYRRKYLPTRQVSYHTPPRFSPEAIATIRTGASLLFRKLHLRDFARIDGWLLPSSTSVIHNSHKSVGEKPLIGEFSDGIIVFSDINIVSGMEQTSFLFQQAAQIGFSHSGILRNILSGACKRNGIPLAVREATSWRSEAGPDNRVWVLFGGNSSERQVSLMSGTNVWLKLRMWPDLYVEPFLLSPGPEFDITDTTNLDSWDVWSLPYASILRHTVEEVIEGCEAAMDPAAGSLNLDALRREVSQQIPNFSFSEAADGIGSFMPAKQSLKSWIDGAEAAGVVVFIAVHGGIGEDGTLQKLFEERKITFTGSGSAASNICMNKFTTGEKIKHLEPEGIFTAKKNLRPVKDLLDSGIGGDDSRVAADFWQELCTYLGSDSICVKPASDGCSTGVAKLSSASDLVSYIVAIRDRRPRLLPGTISNLNSIVEMPVPPPSLLLFEPFLVTDPITPGAELGTLEWGGTSRWIEVTVGVLEDSEGRMRAMEPSVTVKETGDVLSLEEKFQGGTGVNLTPPPVSIMSEESRQRAKQRIEVVASSLGLRGFARIDAFVNVDNGEIIVIEANTVPGMTPSTVLFHQALAEEIPIFPRDFFRKVVDQARSRYS